MAVATSAAMVALLRMGLLPVRSTTVRRGRARRGRLSRPFSLIQTRRPYRDKAVIYGTAGSAREGTNTEGR
jgi:hypothetical protein